MERDIQESDWKLFRRFQPLALERFCERVLADITRLAADTGINSHDRYLAVFKLLQQRDEQLAEAFNGPRRSTALIQLARIQFQDLLTEEEFTQFSPKTRFRHFWRCGGPDSVFHAGARQRARRGSPDVS